MVTSNYTTNTITTSRQTLEWGNSRFTDIDNTLFKLILSNILKLKITNLDPQRTYQWVIKSQPMLPNTSSITADNFVTGVGITEIDIDITLANDFFVAGGSYWFALRDTAGDEKIQIKFEIGQNVVLATGLTVVNNIVGGSWTLSGIAPDQTTNKFVDNASINRVDGTLATNGLIPTNGMVKTYITTLDSANVKLTGNQTIAGVKTFSSAVGAPSPLADGDVVNRLFITSNLLPLPILTAVQNYKIRFDGATEYQVLGLTELLKKIYFATGGVLPDFLAHPEFSFDLSNPASTAFYNAGSFNGGDGNIVNSTVGTMISNNEIKFLTSDSRYITTTYQINLNFRPIPFSNLIVYSGVNSGTNQSFFAGSQPLTNQYILLGLNSGGIYHERGFIQPLGSITNSFSRVKEKKMVFSKILDETAFGKAYLYDEIGGFNTTDLSNPLRNVETYNLQLGASQNLSNVPTNFSNSTFFVAMRFERDISLYQALQLYNLF